MNAARPAHRAFTLVEVMIALVLLSSIALAVTSTLVAAQRARAVSENWMHATELAAEGLEQLRAGHSLGAVRGSGQFDRTGSVAAWNGHAGLYRLEVTVTWNDGEPRHLQLVTLARR
jgi:prepilin-type N-terminal cleavage/methylation domain-containing protein